MRVDSSFDEDSLDDEFDFDCDAEMGSLDDQMFQLDDDIWKVIESDQFNFELALFLMIKQKCWKQKTF